MKRAWAVIVLLVGLVLPAIPAFAEITPADIDDAREGLRELASRLEDQVAAYDAAVGEEAQLRNRLDNLVVLLAVGQGVIGVEYWTGLRPDPSFLEYDGTPANRHPRPAGHFPSGVDGVSRGRPGPRARAGGVGSGGPRGGGTKPHREPGLGADRA